MTPTTRVQPGDRLARSVTASARGRAVVVLVALAFCLLGGSGDVASAEAARLGTAVAPVDGPAAAERSRPATLLTGSRTATSSIDTSDPAAVAVAYRSTFLPSYGVNAPTRTSEQLDACDAGPQPDGLQDATLTQVNYFRAMSGLEPVTFDADLSRQAQQAALMMAANHQLNHNPPASWACYSAVGAAAAGKSNLGLGYRGSAVVAGYMDDDGGTNTPVGHRSWIQRPGATVMGSGIVGNANALYVITPGTARTAPAYVTWPSAGYFPRTLEPGGRWSVIASDSRVSLTDATVSVRGPDGDVLPVTTYPRPNPWGTFVFEVGALRTPAAGAVDDYRVSVSNIEDASGTPVSYTYDVLMFDASSYSAGPLTAVTPPSIAGEARVGQVLTAVPPTWDRDGVADTFRWYVGASSTPAGTGETYTVQPTDAGKTIVVEVSGDVEGHHGSARTAPTGTVPANTATLSITGSSPGPTVAELKVSLSAAGLPPVDGTVELRDGGRLVEALEVRRGSAYFRESGFAGGTHQFSVAFAGTAQVAPAEASTEVVVQDKVVPTMVLTARSTSAKKVRVDVKVDSGARRPTGTVSVAEAGSSLKTGISVSSSGKATWKSSAAPGPHVFDVTYSGSTTVASTTASVSVLVQPKLKAYQSCAALHRDFPHGVGLVGATDRTTGTAVTDFFPHAKLYGYNDGKKPRHHKEKDLDTDDDGIACEAH